MRGNLLGVWRQPAEQEKNKTKRREKDIRAEVLRGYEVARAVIDRGLAKHPDHWALVLARAALMHDENNYRQEIERSAEFAPRRQKAFAEFRRAAQLYAASVAGPRARRTRRPRPSTTGSAPASAPATPSTSPRRPSPTRASPPLIREALAGHPGRGRRAAHGQVRQRPVHPADAGQTLGQVPLPEGRLRDRRRQPSGATTPARCSTITRTSSPRSSSRPWSTAATSVGHEQPFGVFVNLRHTREIERESGGFGRYLQNQNNAGIRITTTSAGRWRTTATSSRTPPSRRSRSTSRSSR